MRAAVYGVAAVITCGAWACGPRAEPAFHVPGADVERGRAIVRAAGCGACHTIPRVPGARGMVGPPLTNIGSRAYIAGQLANEPDAMVAWLLDPPAHDSATAMPRTGLSPAEARDVAAFLYTLGDADPLGPPHLLPKEWLGKW